MDNSYYGVGVHAYCYCSDVKSYVAFVQCDCHSSVVGNSHFGVGVPCNCHCSVVGNSHYDVGLSCNCHCSDVGRSDVVMSVHCSFHYYTGGSFYCGVVGYYFAVDSSRYWVVVQHRFHSGIDGSHYEVGVHFCYNCSDCLYFQTVGTQCMA